MINSKVVWLRLDYLNLYYCFIFSTRRTIFSLITRLTNRTENFRKTSYLKYAEDKNWIEKKLQEGNWEQVRDISKKSSPPAGNAEPETPMSPKRPIETEEGKGKRIKYPNPKYNDPAPEIEPVNLNIPCTLNFDTLGLEDEDNDDENFEPPKKKEPKPLKRKRKNLQHTILAGERCGLTDFQIAMMYNAGGQ